MDQDPRVPGQLPAAGMPWFMTVFGRDTLITCLQTLLFGPELAHNALRVLAELQATEDAPEIDAEPGKIVHEVRHGKGAEAWFARYYGTVDATPLYLVLLSEVWRWTNDTALVRDLHEPALRALSWIDEHGDLDGDGFVEYRRRSERGLANQSWKDSGDSQRFHDGTLAETPIAPCEVQGYVYDAKRRAAELAREVWEDPELAARLDAEADDLQRRFDDAFWCEARGGYYALALDGQKRRVDSLTSNIGHLLWSGIVPPEPRRRDRRAADGRRALVGLGRAHDVLRRRRLQPALLPQRHRVASRQLPHLLGARALRALARVASHRPAHAQRRGALRPSTARGLRRVLADGDPVPDRLSHRGQAPGLGGRHAGPPPPALARASPRSRPEGARLGRAFGFALLARVAQAFGSEGIRPMLGRSPRERPYRDRGGEMRVAVLSPVWFPVPPTRYGGIEWIVTLLAEGLVRAGHDVTLFASGDSSTQAKLVSVYDEAPSAQIGLTQVELRHALACFERADEFDVINDHSGPLAILGGAAVDTPVLHTVHGPLGGEPGLLYDALGRVAPNVGLISVSMNQRKPRPDLNWAANCRNALELDVYPVSPHKGDYLLFLGRMSPDKGCHRAIEVARQAGLTLLIAGKMQDHAEKEYFEEQVRPNLGWGIEYLGEVDPAKKIDLLQNARVTLFPIEWEEPFGLVMIESMACGTPVVATRRGAVPEVIDDGRTGVIVDDYREMPAVLERAAALDPFECRRYVEERFSSERMVRDYEEAYRAALDARADGGKSLLEVGDQVTD